MKKFVIISCIRQNDVNLWFYTKNGMTIAIDSGHLNFRGVAESFQRLILIQKRSNIFSLHMQMLTIVEELMYVEQIYIQMHRYI